jgi:hypothetical protein
MCFTFFRHSFRVRFASPLPTLLRSRCNRAANRKNCFYGGVTGLSGRRLNLCGCVWLAVVAGLLIRRSGCRAGQRGDAGASPECFPGCVSSLAVSILGWPRILPVRLESSFSRWRCAVRVNGMENILLAAAGHCPPAQRSALAWPVWVLLPRLAHFETWPGYLRLARFSPVFAVCAISRLPGQCGRIRPHAPGWS